MTKHKFTREYPINASPKILFPYLSTPGGLARWFCEDVLVDEDKVFNFIWDNQSHYAIVSSFRSNKSIRFIFLDDAKNTVPEPNYIEFSIETTELTQEQYLRVVDYSDDTDLEQLADLWENLLQNLREIVGG
ncbi:MAG: ATPase [Hymenobacteraceae bacterium]|nr:ATPase [Hymenobacteraceae bacterium]MDX5396780.1 ATPase [Hymenobacteraceae bacterium]MDX5443656.1 ATPase [Hymenobacteraceae bacterium]MDX5512843.1 ATPase [Hymenobacteraceae bacterium]